MLAQGRHLGRMLGFVLAACLAAAVAPGHAGAHPGHAHSAAEASGVENTVRKTQEVAGREVVVERHGDRLAALDTAPASAPEPPLGAVAASTIPPSCPTVDRTSDDSANATHPASSAVLKVIYAYPTNVGNRLATYAPVIQAGAQTVGDVVASESGGTQSLRYDIGTTGGPGCIDIQRVPLSQPASFYTAAPQSATFARVRTEVQLALGLQPGTRNYVVYVDGVAPAGVAGEAQVRFDDSAAGTFQNRGGLWALLYGRGGTDFFGSGFAYAPGTTSRTHVDTALHEISHTLGAVQGSAPNRSTYNHCLDEWDILCYDDDGASGLSTSVVCRTPYSAAAQAWDCGKNDYFNPSPAPGSYLATHWNLTRSVFLCQFATCGPGGTPASPGTTEPTSPGGPQPAAGGAQGQGGTARKPPETRVISGPRGKRNGRNARFVFGADRAAASFECRLDRGRPRPCSSPQRYSRLRPGRHTFQVSAVDGSGLADLTPARRSFTVARGRAR